MAKSSNREDKGKGWQYRMAELGVKCPALKRGSKAFRKPIPFDAVEDYEAQKPSPKNMTRGTIKALNADLDR
jgi:hypothetical protein